jgi:hypothetical protein
MPNLTLGFAEVLAAGLAAVTGWRWVTAQESSAAGLAGAGGTTGGGATGSSSAMLAAAEAAAAASIPYSQAVNSSGLLAGFRSDCSGFVDYVLKAGGVDVGSDTTVTLPTAQNIEPGEGSTVTLWNLSGNASDPDSGHVIMDIAGQWFESGGQSSLGPHEMTVSEVESELGVSSLSDLANDSTPRGFYPYHPAGM